MAKHDLLRRLAIKLTSRKVWGILIVVAFHVFLGYAGGWELTVQLATPVFPVVFGIFMGSIAWEKGKENGQKPS